MASETSGGRCLRAKARRHYNEGEHQDDEIEGRRMFTLDDKIDEEKYKSDLVKSMEGHELTFKFFQEHGFETPMVFRKPDGLGLKVPTEDFGVNDVRQLVGARRVVDCMDVTTQKAETMTMAQFAKYFAGTDRERLLNVISLEFSHTKLDELVSPPTVVNQIDWVDTVWPRHLKRTQRDSTNAIAEMKYPKVQKYCLMSVGGCYTDFHVDFGGTSVWYHLLHGEKIFWLIPPTQKNLDMYQAWVLSGKQGEIFLGEKVAECSMVHLVAGNTFMIPSGWIHAVYTPADSLVFGGNILHSFAIDRQLKVTAMEDSTHVPPKFRYPFFYEINWYCLERYVHTLMGKTYLKPHSADDDDDDDDASQDQENILPSGSKIERKDSTDSDKTIDVGIKQESVKDEEEEVDVDDDDDRSSTYDDPDTPEHSRSSTPTKPLTSLHGQNGLGTEHGDDSQDTKLDNAKDEGESSQGSKVKSCLCSFEKKGLSEMVRVLAGMPASKRFVPDLITDADALLQDAREMMKIHEGDDPLSALTGEPMLMWPKTPKRRKDKSSRGGKSSIGSSRPASKKGSSGLRKRRTKCRKCENCLRSDCRECNFCKDMKKYGGSGKMKQSCKMKRCTNPRLPSNCRCYVCLSDDRSDPDNTLMECHQCNEVSHPECLRSEGYVGEGVINDEMGNSWECPKCCTGEAFKQESDGGGDETPVSRSVLKRKQMSPEDPDSGNEMDIKPAPKKRGRPPASRRANEFRYAYKNGKSVYAEDDDEDDDDDDEDYMVDSPDPKPLPKRGFRGRGRLGFRRTGRASRVSYHQQRLAKQKVQQAKYHYIRGTRRRGRTLRLSRRNVKKRNQEYVASAPEASVPGPSVSKGHEDLSDAVVVVNSPIPPKLTPLSIPALEPEVVLMEKAKPTVTPLYVVRPAPISPPPSTFMLEDETPHQITHDTWMKIFKHLPQKDICRCMRVCKIWNRWCCDPILWRCISIARMTPIPATALRGLVLRQPRSLDLNWTNISKQHIMWLLARLPGLRALYLQGSSWDAVSAMCSSICPALRLLDLHWVSGIKDSSLKRLLSPISNHRPGMVDDKCHLRFLTDLRLTGSDISDTSMMTLRQCTPLLTKLDLQHCRKITDEGIRILASEMSPLRHTLRELNMANNNNITDACILSLRRVTGLQRVVVHCCPEINRDSWTFYGAESGVNVVLIRPPRPARTAPSHLSIF